ncbi:hypothetical protein ACOZ0W_001954 [Cronobacter dublinensis]
MTARIYAVQQTGLQSAGRRFADTQRVGLIRNSEKALTEHDIAQIAQWGKAHP